jgi:hypothetical protein
MERTTSLSTISLTELDELCKTELESSTCNILFMWYNFRNKNKVENNKKNKSYCWYWSSNKSVK